MADNLFPTCYETENASLLDMADTAPVGYKSGLHFDYENGDFLQNGRKRIRDADGVESWRGWCKTCLLTERYACLAYNTDFGISTAEAFAADSHEKAEALLTREITEALMADPYGRTEYIEDIVFNWLQPDTVQVTVTVRGIDNVSIDVTAEITR